MDPKTLVARNLSLLRTMGLTLITFGHLASAAAADAPTPPVSGSDFDATQALVADPILGFEPGEDGQLYSLEADTISGMASVTKSFTLLMAVEAIMDGLATLDDIVQISNFAASINNGHSGGHSVAGLSAAQTIRFEPLLYGMMLPSGGDASIAIAEHIVDVTYPGLVNASSIVKHDLFVLMMNQRAADLELEDTVFYNPYGGDHAHDVDNTPGASVPHSSTPRDVARWFKQGLEYPLFREIAGFRGTYPGFGWTSGFSYPGLVAQKPGGNGSCTSCRGAASRRVGRELIGAFQQGTSGDMIPLLDYGFADLFHPVLEAESAPFTDGWIANDLACVDAGRAVSAVVKPNGTLRMLLWGTDFESGSIEHLNDYQVGLVSAADSFQFDRPSDRDSLELQVAVPVVPPYQQPRQLTTATVAPPPPRGTTGLIATNVPRDPRGDWDAADDVASGARQPIANAVRVVYAGSGYLVATADTDQGVYLYSYGIKQNDTISQFDMAFLGTGDLGRVVSLGNGLIVTGHRTPSDRLEIASYRLNLDTGLLSNALDTSSPTNSIGDDFEFDGGPTSLIGRNLFAVTSTSGGQHDVRSWQVNPLTGALSWQDTDTMSGTARGLQVARVRGYEGRDIYAAAYRDAQERLAVEVYEVMSNGDVINRGAAAQFQNVPLDADASIRMAAFREGGVMIGVQGDQDFAAQTLEVWSFDPRSWSETSTVNITSLFPNRIALETSEQDGLTGICRLPGDAAEGDFVLATGVPGVSGITLEGWRSAPRN